MQEESLQEKGRQHRGDQKNERAASKNGLREMCIAPVVTCHEIRILDHTAVLVKDFSRILLFNTMYIGTNIFS